MTYLAFFIWESGLSAGTLQLCLDAEAALDRVAVRAEGSGIWRVSEDDEPAVRSLLLMYEEQLSSVPLGVFLQAEDKLKYLLRTEHTVSPIKQYSLKSA